MAILSSHLLNSITGEHAAFVKINIFKIEENKKGKKVKETSTAVSYTHLTLPTNREV